MTNDIHGGNIYRKGRNIRLDLSANINPLGMPESVKKAAKDAVDISDRYPDHSCGELREKLASLWKVRQDMIFFGNGADDLIFRIVNAIRPKHALIAVPTFSEYEKALEAVGCNIIKYRLNPKNGFVLDEYILDVIDEYRDVLDMMILCSPNNPTGRLIDRGLLDRINQKCNYGIYFLLDECFAELTEYGVHYCFPFGGISEFDIVLRAFTKTYAMAGLRLGYAVFGSKDMYYETSEQGQFWSVSTVAQAAGAAALEETGYVKNAVELISAEREYLSNELKKFGFTVYPSDANFILFRCDIPLDEMLLNNGILIRNCDNFDGLGEGYFRTAVRTHEENEELVKTIEKVIKWQNA